MDIVKHLLEFLEKDWKKISVHSSPVAFKTDQTIFYEGHHPYGLFVILKGRVRFVAGDCPSPHPEHHFRIEQGDVVGLPHVWDDTPACCSCVADTDCEALFISKTLLLQHLKKEPKPKKRQSQKSSPSI